MFRIPLGTLATTLTLVATSFAQQATPAGSARPARVEPTKVLQPNVTTTRIATPIGDGAMIAAVDDGGFDIQIVDTVSMTPKLTLKGHTAKVNAIALTADGRKLVSASDDKTVRIWSLADGKELSKRVHAEAVPAVQVFPNGRVASAVGTRIEVWDPATPDAKPVATFSDHKGMVTHIAASRDGKHVVSVGVDLAICYWAGDDAKLIMSFTPHKDHVTALGIDDLGQKAVSAGKDGTIVVWDLAQRKESARSIGLATEATAANFSPDGKQIVAASAERVRCFDAATLKEMYELAPFRTKALCASFTKDGTRIIAAGDLDPTVTDAARKGSIKVYPAR